MPKVSRQHRVPAVLPHSLARRLNSYALAATGAGVGLLTLAQPAHSEIVYTKTHQVIGPNGIYPLDLNGDGVVDFLIMQTYFLGYQLLTREALGNAVEGYSFGPFASALPKGVWIGPSQGFVRSGYEGERMATVSYYYGNRYVRGPWAYVTNHYLGLKFRVQGVNHYGWARVSVAIQGHTITATLTGYAYETVPKTRLRAGKIPSSTGKASGALSRSLGALARGAYSPSGLKK